MALLGFAVATAYCPTVLSAAFVPRWAAIAVGVPLASRLDPREVPSSIRWMLLFVLGAAAISTTWASPDYMTGYYELFCAILLCLAFIAAAGLDSLDDLMIGMGLGVAISSYGLLWAMNSDEGRTAYASTAGLFYNSEVFAEFSVIIFVWALLRPRPFIAVVTFLPVMFCESRIAIVIAAGAILYAFRPASKLLTAAISLAFIVGAASMVFALGEDKISSAGQRIILWLATGMAWTQFGHGFGWFATVHPSEQFAHSDAIQAVAEIGLAAFALLLIPIIALRRNRGNNAERAAFIAACFEVAVSFPLHFPAAGFAAAVLAGYLVSNRRMVLLGDHVGGVYDGAGIQRQTATDKGAPVFGRSSGSEVPVRSASALGQALCARENSFNPALCGI